jgi:hypothetical protein
MLKPGQVVVTEGLRTSWISRAIAWASGSWATHVFVVTGPDEAVEAVFPRVKILRLQERLDEMRKDGRAVVVMGIPEIGGVRASWAARNARSFVGRWYDIGQVFLYAILRRFVNDGAGTLMCSRLVTAAYADAGVKLFDEATLRKWYLHRNHHVVGLRNGFATPGDLLRSRLVVEDFIPSKTIRSLQDLSNTA